MTTLTVPQLNCKRCNWVWFARRVELPLVCPRCKTRRYREPRPDGKESKRAP
jgi:predicted Zn-ribbon and HTH transcriptional regulator